MKTMDSPEIDILDVGHGNCAVLIDSQRVVVVTLGPVTPCSAFSGHGASKK